MTVDESKRRLINYANSQIGYPEGPNNWNKYAEKMDKINGLTWGAKQNYEWCGEFVLACFVECFGVDLGLKMQYSPKPTGIPLCRLGAGYFQTAGQFYKRPEAGDVVFFYVGSEINHTGIVTNVGMGAITTVEGNSSDMVARRTYDVNSPAIAGFGRPKWELAENYDPEQDPPEEPEPEPEPEPKPVVMVKIELPQITEGDIGDSVKAAQALLDCWGFPCGSCGADGEYGPDTKRALTRFQKYRRLEQDGVIGPDTWSALLGVREE